MTKLSTKLSAIIVCAATGVVLLAALAIWQGSSLSSSAAHLGEQHARSYRSLEEAVRVQGKIQDLLRLNDVDAIEAGITGLEEARKSLAAHLETLPDKGPLQQNARFASATDAMLDRYLKGDTAFALEALREEVIPAFAKLTEVLAKLNETESRKALQQVEDQKSSTQTIALALAVLIVGVLVTVSTVIVRAVLRQVGGEPGLMAKAAEAIAAGDLTDAGKPDAAASGVQLALSQMGDSLRSIISTMNSKVGTLSSASGAMSSMASDLKRSMEESRTKVSGVAAASEQMSANMATVSHAIGDASVNVGGVAAAAEELNATITDISKRTAEAQSTSGTAVKTANETMAVVSRLGDAAGQIDSVTSAIAQISDQTKLLALNATIEAARAGTAGKGFAVVASEIKELAKQVSDATGGISDRVLGIKKASEDAQRGIRQMAEVIGAINSTMLSIGAAVEEQTATVKEIAQRASQVAGRVSEVSANVEQASLASGDIAKTAALINEEIANLAGASGGLESFQPGAGADRHRPQRLGFTLPRLAQRTRRGDGARSSPSTSSGLGVPGEPSLLKIGSYFVT
ncbi:MAG: methyl-accepting chemotaxis protein [Myxococcales bacterium]